MNPLFDLALAKLSNCKVLLQFNKHNGAHTATLGWVDPTTLNNEHYVYETVEVFNADTDEVVGFYPNHKVQKRDLSKHTVYEFDVDDGTHQAITSQYPLTDQLNILTQMVQVMADRMFWQGGSTNATFTRAKNALDEMRTTITTERQRGRTNKAALMADPNVTYVSNEQYAEQERVRNARPGSGDPA